MRLDKNFYSQNAVEMAPMLLGKLLCRNINGEIIKLRVTETESYFGEDDTACHAHKGKTERTRILYENGGFAYVYLCYGIHSLLNVVSGKKDFPEAVLIRGLTGYPGPGRLTKAMQIDRKLNKENLILSDRLWFEDDGFRPSYQSAARIGIAYADEKDRVKLWRHYTT